VETQTLLDVTKLKMYFPVYGGIFRHKIAKVHAVDGVTFSIQPGETLGLVGESGCGKTTVGRCMVGLYKPSDGEVCFEGKALLKMNREQMQAVRRNLQIIFQDPFESLNSRHTVGEILEEPFIIHRIGAKAQRKAEVLNLLSKVGLPENTVNRFPHEFSGGQRQRISIARAIALSPKLIICDEPVSALDVSIQSQVINLLLTLQKEMGLSYLFITHDLSVVKHVSDQIAVMYLGKIVEQAQADALYSKPAHPYTRALISAIPIPDPSKRSKRMVLKGDVPSPINPPEGCRFQTRCLYAQKRCRTEEPVLRFAPHCKNGRYHRVACHRAEEIAV
jgi:oligopeptide/dipeptide ABC transporter ATP-binding protein